MTEFAGKILVNYSEFRGLVEKIKSLEEKLKTQNEKKVTKEQEPNNMRADSKDSSAKQIGSGLPDINPEVPKPTTEKTPGAPLNIEKVHEQKLNSGEVANLTVTEISGNVGESVPINEKRHVTEHKMPKKKQKKHTVPWYFLGK